MVRVDEVARVTAVTGEDSPNRTGSRFGVHGTDLGIMWDNGRHEILVVFGDSYGSEWGGRGAGPAHADWRCNFVARSTTTDLDSGLDLTPVATRPDGAAAEAIGRDPGARHEVTVIPTSGIAVGEVNYLHYMSVAQWNGPGRWRTNHGGIAVSEDGGVTWRKPESARWPGDRRRMGVFDRLHEHPFQMGAFVGAGEHVYLFGTPSGRFGAATLARVEPDRVLDPGAYRYWDGADFGTDDPFASKPVMAGPVGELSVQFHEYTGRWLAVHLDERRAALVLRSAPRLTGPWDPGTVLVSAAEYPAPYGGYLHPWALDGPKIYFTLSQWNTYNVSLLRAVISTG